MLVDKDGRPCRETNIIQQHHVWHPESNSKVRLITIRHMLQSKYTDLKIQAFARKLPKSTFELLPER